MANDNLLIGAFIFGIIMLIFVFLVFTGRIGKAAPRSKSKTGTDLHVPASPEYSFDIIDFDGNTYRYDPILGAETTKPYDKTKRTYTALLHCFVPGVGVAHDVTLADIALIVRPEHIGLMLEGRPIFSMIKPTNEEIEQLNKKLEKAEDKVQFANETLREAEGDPIIRLITQKAKIAALDRSGQREAGTQDALDVAAKLIAEQNKKKDE